ncbi:activating transcription factor 7-interacting protein 1 isoform X2 [Aethina tumida]|uniref:activating transcription factor 7-interacting protein 1 isoform X2 n=1 Tax=Aethina tumida TaxID=116153 RepID=UPI0021493791|nr:activating transcription factor 7-interacting protein 1 isoform X2 [Aethina tumida]XP_049819608.1 activating transcription factor 7-interacting protein 1 isoform X2 [Aethina tumida]
MTSIRAEQKKDMATVSETLQIFDKYKTREDDERSSDEESFHLPIDDEEIEKRDGTVLTNGKEESEDDILDKFESSCPQPDIDPALEESLLNDDEIPAISNEKTNKKSASKKSVTRSAAKASEKNTKQQRLSRKSATGEKNSQQLEKTDNQSTKDSNKTDNCEVTDKTVHKKDDHVDDGEQSSKINRDETENTDQDKNEESKTKEVEEPDKCENSNDSKSNNSEGDLLDISIIRDVDEDDANAREEDDKDRQSREKVDNEEGSDKVSESGAEQPEQSHVDEEAHHIENDKGEADVETHKEKDTGEEQDNEYQDVDMKENVSESTDTTEKLDRDVTKMDEDEIDTEKENENPDMSQDEDDLPLKTIKRSLSSTDSDSSRKKIRLDESTSTESMKSEFEETPKCLTTFAQFMSDRKLPKLTRSDLEQFALQKICEAIIRKTNVGELNQKVKKYEAIIETLRKDVAQLAKQARDLEIVNRKLMNEIKSQTGTDKPLVPLKITRSVGLQVKLNYPEGYRRRSTGSATGSPQKNPTPQTTRGPKPAQQVFNRMNSTPKTSPNLLAQALQPRRVVTNQTPTPPPKCNVTVRKSSESPRSSVIDLTDEDDRANKGRSKSVPLNKVKTVTVSQNKTINVGNNKTITVNQTKTIPLNQQKTGMSPAGRTVATIPQGVRLTPTQLKNGSITLPGVVASANSPQLMYVVQPSSQGLVTTTAGGTQKAVFVNFQPTTNGMLTSPLNGSTVSMIPTKTSSTVQIKPVRNVLKHPAPLPAPPVIRVTSDHPLKPIPPKPHLSIKKKDSGIILQWKMPYPLDNYETIASYQLYAYQETSGTPTTDMWRRVGDVKALALPMACTLTQFADKNKYYFAVRPVDVHKRIGAFSDPEEISL